MHNDKRQLQLGERVMVHALRADGMCYRWWPALVEQVHDDSIVTYVPVATVVEGTNGGWIQPHYIRAFYWFDRRYNLSEVYRAEGSLVELYINIASPAQLHDHTISYTDHELDVVMSPGEAPRIVDDDEFLQAITQYGYSPDLQALCRTAAAEALQIAAAWQAGGFPFLTGEIG